MDMTLYFEPKGDLYVDGNGGSKGFGKKSEGGMIADLPNDTILTGSDADRCLNKVGTTLSLCTTSA